MPYKNIAYRVLDNKLLFGIRFKYNKLQYYVV